MKREGGGTHLYEYKPTVWAENYYSDMLPDCDYSKSNKIIGFSITALSAPYPCWPLSV